MMLANAVQYVKDAISPTTKLFVTLSRPSYWEGDTVQGTVTVMSVVVPYHVEVVVKLKGIAQGDKPDSIYTNETKYIAKEVHVKQQSTIFNGEITQCNQIIPFKFTLPQVCPGSFNCESSGSNGKVYYYVRGSMKVVNKKLRHKRISFEVYERSGNVVPIRARHPEVSHLTISAWLDRNVFFPGDSMLVRLKINNENNAMTRNMRISLMHVARYKEAYTDDNNVGAPNIICKKQITAAPPCYFGIKWIHFTIPATLHLLSSTHGAIISSFFIQIDDFNRERKLTIPITILAYQTLNSLHPAPPAGILPPPVLIRPPLQPDEEATQCNSCETAFGVMKFMSHCRHCGKVFCTNCVNSTIRIPKLGLCDPAKVCRACKRVIEETGGVPYQVPKQVMEEWTSKCDNDEVKWVRKSKKEYKWIETPTFDPFTVCYQALPPPYLFSFLPTPLRKLRYNFKNTFSEIF